MNVGPLLAPTSISLVHLLVMRSSTPTLSMPSGMYALVPVGLTAAAYAFPGVIFEAVPYLSVRLKLAVATQPAGGNGSVKICTSLPELVSDSFVTITLSPSGVMARPREVEVCAPVLQRPVTTPSSRSKASSSSVA